MVNALAFFQWRCRTLEDPAAVARNKEIFYSRVDYLIRSLEDAVKKKKQTVVEESKDGGIRNRQKIPEATNNPRKLMSQDTIEVLVMQEQKKDRSIFSSVVIETKHKIASFDTIGWTDPSQPNANKTLKWLKSLTHDSYVYPEDLFDPEKPPTCIFVPELPIWIKLIETVAKNPGSKEQIY